MKEWETRGTNEEETEVKKEKENVKVYSVRLIGANGRKK
jgi:hypothetical protein